MKNNLNHKYVYFLQPIQPVQQKYLPREFYNLLNVQTNMHNLIYDIFDLIAQPSSAPAPVVPLEAAATYSDEDGYNYKKPSSAL